MGVDARERKEKKKKHESMHYATMQRGNFTHKKRKPNEADEGFRKVWNGEKWVGCAGQDATLHSFLLSLRL